MSDVLALGDNTVDCYVDRGLEYPGGNALNVAVFCRRQGISTSYLGCVGDDPAGAWLAAILDAEDVSTDRLRIRAGATARSGVAHRDGDRRFLWGLPGVRARYDLTQEDLHYVSRHALTHTTIHSDLLSEIPKLRGAAPRLSFDFSDCWDTAGIDQLASCVDVMTLSAAQSSDEDTLELAKRCHQGGTAFVVITRGTRSALLSDRIGGRLHWQTPMHAEIRDTLGAGDAFIAAVLVGCLADARIDEIGHRAAVFAAKACGEDGAFGYGRVAHVTPA